MGESVNNVSFRQGFPVTPFRVRLLHAIFALILVFFAGCGGCGGKSEPGGDPYAPWGGMGSKEAYLAWKAKQDAKDESKAKEPEANPQAPPKNKAEEANQDEAEKTSAGSEQAPRKSDPRRPRPVPKPVAAPPADPAQLPPLPHPPSDVSTWHEQDFYVARVLEEPTLLEAIDRAAQDRRDDEKLAEILTRLLQPAEYEGLQQTVHGIDRETRAGSTRSARRRMDASAGPRGEASYSRKVIESAIDALAKNTTPAASRALAQLILGKLATEDNATVAKTALESLATCPTEVHEEMLLRLAVEAEQLVAASGSTVRADSLSRRAFELLEEKATAAGRVRMAGYLLENNPSPTVRAKLENVLREVKPENLEAQVALYVRANGPNLARDTLAEQFAACSSRISEHLLGLQFSTNVEQSEFSARAAGLLWSDSFALAVEGRLNRLDSWADDPSLLSLALSLPSDVMRAALASRLDRQWWQGPNVDAAQLLADKALIEPGFLVLLRAAQSQHPESAKLPSLTAIRNPRARRGRSERPGTQPSQHDIQAEWAELANSLALFWCERCRTAAHDRDAAERAEGRRIDWTNVVKALPVKPHSEDGLTAAHVATWAGGISHKKDGTAFDPLRVSYARIEERTRPTRLLAYYRRLLPDHQERAIPEGLCFEGMLKNTETGFLACADVRITRAAPEVRKLPEDDQELVVEVLVVQIRDPAISPSAEGE